MHIFSLHPCSVLSLCPDTLNSSVTAQHAAKMFFTISTSSMHTDKYSDVNYPQCMSSRKEDFSTSRSSNSDLLLSLAATAGFVEISFRALLLFFAATVHIPWPASNMPPQQPCHAEETYVSIRNRGGFTSTRTGRL